MIRARHNGSPFFCSFSNRIIISCFHEIDLAEVNFQCYPDFKSTYFQVYSSPYEMWAVCGVDEDLHIERELLRPLGLGFLSP